MSAGDDNRGPGFGHCCWNSICCIHHWSSANGCIVVHPYAHWTDEETESTAIYRDEWGVDPQFDGSHHDPPDPHVGKVSPSLGKMGQGRAEQYLLETARQEELLNQFAAASEILVHDEYTQKKKVESNSNCAFHGWKLIIRCIWNFWNAIVSFRNHFKSAVSQKSNSGLHRIIVYHLSFSNTQDHQEKNLMMYKLICVDHLKRKRDLKNWH